MEIIAKNVSKNIKEKILLKNINIHVKDGEVYGLIGPNGAGKSTFIRLVLGIYTKFSGIITVNGVNVLDNKAFTNLKYKIGAVLDHLGLYKDLTAFQNVEFFHRIYFPKAKATIRNNDILEVLGLVNLLHKKDEKINLFSKGEKQRLALARAFINKPNLLILDEPTIGLDVEGVFMVREYIKNVKKLGTTILISSHNLSELQRICDTCGFIQNGVMLEEASFDELVSKYCVNNDKNNNDTELEIIYKSIFNKHRG